MRDEVAIAILSAIEPPLPGCLAAVEAQVGGPYRVIHVKNCFPMSHAFNEMIRLSDPSKYVVQVDGDVVLKPWAVQRLYEAIRTTRWCYMAWGQLYEDGFGLGGAVRIWRRWPVELLGFRDTRCVDRNLHHRMRLLGVRRLEVLDNKDINLVQEGETFGIHYPRNTPFARFSKARNDAMKWRHLGRWDLIEQANAKGFSLEGLLGCRDGLFSEINEVDRSKNVQRDWHRFLTRPRQQ